MPSRVHLVPEQAHPRAGRRRLESRAADGGPSQRLRRARPRAVRDPGLAHGRGADARLHERGGAAPARARPASCTCGAARATSCGTRARPPATRRPSRRCATTATPTPCSRSSSPPAPPATPASARASSPATSTAAPHEALPGLERTLAARAADAPEGSYTAELLADPPRIGEKVQEEAEEVARAAREESDERVAEEAADVLYHLPCCCAAAGSSLADAEEVLRCPPPLTHLEVTPERSRRPRALAGEHNLIPVTHTFIEDCETPVSAFLKLRGDGPAFLLESAEQGQRVGRWSFIGWRPRRVLRWSLAGRRRPVRAGRARPCPRTARRRSPGLPPFAGGAVGFFGYDCVRAVERLPEPNPDVLGLPDMALMLSDVIVAFDHLRHTVTILANAYLDEDGGVEAAHARAVEAIREVRARLAGPLPRPQTLHGRAPGAAVRVQHAARARSRAMVARIVEYVHAGDAFQVVPSPALVGADARRAVLDLPRAAGRQPVAVHVLPRLRGLPDRRRLAGAAADRLRPPRLHAPDRRHPAARRATTPRSPPSCSPTRRSAPST